MCSRDFFHFWLTIPFLMFIILLNSDEAFMSITNDFLDEQIAETKALIKSHQAAQLAISSGQLDVYTLDTNQSRVTVTRQNLSVLKNVTKSLLNQLSVLCAARTGSGSYTTIPGW